MEREIKFRAYWKGVNKFKYFDCPTLTCGDNKGVYGMFFPSTDGSVYLGSTKPEQYTGLKDKNGKEGYEGDIIKIVYYPLFADPKIIEYYHLGVLLWDGSIQLKIEGTNILNEEKKSWHHKNESKRYQHPTAGFDYVDRSIWLHKCEIIGNIHQNPDLL